MRVRGLAVLLLLLVASPSLAAKLTLSGDVTYRERVALPSGATLRLQLIDAARPDAPPRLDVAAPIGEGQVPLNFSLALDDALVIPGHAYELIAAISAGGTLLFRNFEPVPIDFAAENAPVHVLTRLVSTAYSAPASAAPALPPAPSLEDIVWTVTSIGDLTAPPRSAPTLTVGTDLRAGGSTGCNSWFAQANIDGDALSLGGITATSRTCTDALVPVEAAFKDALLRTAQWKRDGDRLSLFAADGKLLLELAR